MHCLFMIHVLILFLPELTGIFQILFVGEEVYQEPYLLKNIHIVAVKRIKSAKNSAHWKIM